MKTLKSFAFGILCLYGCAATAQSFPTANTQASTEAAPTTFQGKKLVFHDEFNAQEGTPPDADKWSFENGFVRNQELQWYSSDNARTDGKGNMVIVGKIERIKNPNYIPKSKSWKTNRPYAEYTSSCLRTIDKYAFRYGTLIVRAKIPTTSGAWPAIWTLGTQHEWPLNGEIDIMEYYIKHGVRSILANAAWGGHRRYKPIWNSKVIPLRHFLKKDNNWQEQYHIWRMDWDENDIRIYLDDELLNHIPLSETISHHNMGLPGEGENPFHQAQYILLNLAVGQNGGKPDKSRFPLHYYIDYVRVYQ